MKNTRKPLLFAKLPRDYRLLCDLLLPRPVHDKIGYENAIEIVEAMAGFEDQFSRDQGDYFALLTDLISTYEDENEEQGRQKARPLCQRLQYLLESAQWNASDLGRFLGLDATMGNKILREERKLTASHIRKLSRHFSIGAEYFL